MTRPRTEDAPIDERRELLAAVAAVVVVRPEMIGIDLNCAAGHGSGRLNMNPRDVRQDIRILAPRRKAA